MRTRDPDHQHHETALADGISIVVPVYRSSSSLLALAERITLTLQPVRHEIIFVDDGSPGPTWTTIEELAASQPNVFGLRLSRRAGQHAALLAGVRAARFKLTATLDDDLQNPPEEIPKLLLALSEDFDVVYGHAETASHAPWRRLTSRLMRGMMVSILGAANGVNVSSYRVFRTRLRGGFEVALGPGISLDALLSWSTTRFTSVEVEHNQRADGESNYRFRDLLRFAVDTATGYSTAPLRMALALGLLTSMFGLVVLAWVVGRYLLVGSYVAGFPFLASIVAIFSGVQLFTLGVIGEYLARMHFRIMRKPSYVIADSTSQISAGPATHGDPEAAPNSPHQGP